MSVTINSISKKVKEHDATLLVVSKRRSNEDIKKIYDMGFRHMGENRVQDLLDKKDDLPQDIKWHIIGSLQRNKVKYIAEFIHCIHSVDSLKLAQEIDKQAKKYHRKIPILLQFLVAEEDSKHGLAPSKKFDIVNSILEAKLNNIEIQGIMGMASFTSDTSQIKNEFKKLHSIFLSLKQEYKSELDNFKELSMGMSGDFELALEEGSTIVRLGSILFDNL